MSIGIVENKATTSVEQNYAGRTPASGRTWSEALDVFPHGVSGQAKIVSPHPIFVESALGSHVTDVDGRSYVDLLMGAGPLLIGHSHPDVVAAIQQQIAKLTNPMMPTRLSLDYARRLQDHMPYLERLRFTNTGSEATRSAVRVARAATGRTKIAKFEGNYHGSDDWALVSTHVASPRGPRLRPEAVVDYAGMSPRLVDEIVVLPFNEAAATTALLDEHGPDLAAVIMEPVAFSSGGGVPAELGFVRAVREAADKHGIVLIFDEVLCAFRLGLGGAPSYLGVVPDLAAAGKAVGGGMPLALFGGRRDLMEATLGPGAGDRRIFQSGTFTENPVSIVSGAATLTVLETTDALARADGTAESIRQGLSDIFARHGIPAAVNGIASIIQMHAGVESVRDRRDVLAGDIELTRKILLGMTAGGVLWPPVHPAVTSGAHTQQDVDRVLSVFDDVLSQLA